jgi:DNA-binding transcriptional regulator YiaG
MRPIDIRRLRKRLKVTQEQLADILGAGRHSVIRWEAGETKPLGGYLKALRELQKKAKKKKKS